MGKGGRNDPKGLKNRMTAAHVPRTPSTLCLLPVSPLLSISHLSVCPTVQILPNHSFLTFLWRVVQTLHRTLNIVLAKKKICCSQLSEFSHMGPCKDYQEVLQAVRSYWIMLLCASQFILRYFCGNKSLVYITNLTQRYGL